MNSKPEDVTHEDSKQLEMLRISISLSKTLEKQAHYTVNVKLLKYLADG